MAYEPEVDYIKLTAVYDSTIAGQTDKITKEFQLKAVKIGDIVKLFIPEIEFYGTNRSESLRGHIKIDMSALGKKYFGKKDQGTLLFPVTVFQSNRTIYSRGVLNLDTKYMKAEIIPQIALLTTTLTGTDVSKNGTCVFTDPEPGASTAVGFEDQTNVRNYVTNYCQPKTTVKEYTLTSDFSYMNTWNINSSNQAFGIYNTVLEYMVIDPEEPPTKKYDYQGMDYDGDGTDDVIKEDDDGDGIGNLFDLDEHPEYDKDGNGKIDALDQLTSDQESKATGDDDGDGIPNWADNDYINNWD